MTKVYEVSDNPPAFPRGDFGGGMTLRDYFAGQALVGIISGCAAACAIYDTHEAAEDAYQVADAMLAARKTQNAAKEPEP